MNIIIMTCIPMIQQHLTDLYVESIAKSHPVLLWDLSGLYNRDEQVSHRVENCQKIKSLEELDQELSRVTKPALIITNIMFYSLKRIYATVKRHGIPIANITKEGLAYHLFESNWRSLDVRYGFMDAAKTMARKIGPVRRTINWVVNGPVKYDYLLANGNFYPEYTRHFVKIHHVKYDEYLQSRSLPPIIEGTYALFLDTAATTHPFYGLKRHASKRKVDAQGYIDRLNRFFDQIEKEHNLPVIIAAHPKAEYDEATFNGRPIIKYKTGQLIEHSSLVLSHYSTSVINAVLAEKPLVFLWYPEMLYSMQKYMAIGAIEYAKRLKAAHVNLDHPESFEIHVNAKAYRDFIETFLINKKTRDQSNSELLLQFIDQLEVNRDT
ncbi:MAG: hypothetical protein PHQ83_10020 [Eubacteriales bacterium]|nr:hypothetical protein [Eubacteriales bacterium]